MKIDPMKPEMFLGGIESEVYNAGYEFDFSSRPDITLRPRDTSDPMPIVVGEYEHNDEYFWYITHMKFPAEVSEGTYTGHFHYVLDKWIKAARLADYLSSHQWSLEEEYED